MGLHSKQTISDGIHSAVSYEYADSTARLAATGFVATDLYKFAIDLDTKQQFVLTSVSPITWTDVGNAAVAQDLNKVEIAAIKATAGTIARGQPVTEVGWDTVNNRALVELAQSTPTGTQFGVGIASTQITDSVEGKFMVLGVLTDLDTSSFAAPAPLYLDTALGGLTNVEPAAPNLVQPLGIVSKSDPAEGVIGVSVEDFRYVNNLTPPSALSKTASAGAARTMSPADHVHPFGKGVQVNNGFVDRSEVSLAFSQSTRELTITPTGSDFTFYSDQVEYTKSSAETLQIPDLEGVHVIYYDASGTLVSTQDGGLLETIITDHAIVAAVYWDAENSKTVIAAPETHGSDMSGTTHLWAHESFGSQIVDTNEDSFAFSNFSIDGDGTLDAHAQFAITGGSIRDEDILFVYSDGSPQDLTPTAQVPVFWISGANGYFRREPATAFPVYNTGTGRVAWNEYTGALWQRTEATDGYYVLYHIFVTNDMTEPLISVMGQAEYQSLSEAQVGATTEINDINATQLKGLLNEFIPLGTLIVQTSDSYTNSVKARFVSARDGSDYVDWRPQLVTAKSLTAGGSVDYAQTITVAKSGGQYSEIQTAIDSITDASSSKVYTVLVYPGTYTEAITTKAYVNIRGVGGGVKIFVTSGSALTMSDANSNVHNVTIEGYYTALTANTDLISITNGDHIFGDVIVQGTALSGDYLFSLINHSGGTAISATSYFVYVRSGGGSGLDQAAIRTSFEGLNFSLSTIQAIQISGNDSVACVSLGTNADSVTLAYASFLASNASGDAYGIRLEGGNGAITSHGNIINVTGSGIAYGFDIAGVSSSYTNIHCSLTLAGATTYYGRIASGCTLNSLAATSNTFATDGTGTHNISGSDTSGDTWITGNLTDGTISKTIADLDAGEANTASNVGTAGVGVFKQKTSEDLEFKSINAGSSKVTVTDDTVSNEIDIDVAEAQLNIGNQSGSLANDTAHGDRGGGSLHSEATTSVSGFMSSSDKTKLDTVQSGAGVFGADYQTQVSAGESTTTSATFQTKVTLTTPALTGDYLVTWMARVGNSNVNASFEVQCYNTTDSGTVGGLFVREPKDATDKISFNAFEEISFSGAAKSFEIQYRTSGGTCSIDQARIMIYRVS